jgi:enamine deaminase RidA (YjgF/YER057c/UK114 family)
MTQRILHPHGWAKPRGYANGISTSGRFVFVAGQVGWNPSCVFESDDFVAQTAQALRNIVAILAEDGAAPEHIARMTWYVTDRGEYLRRAKEIGAVYREIVGRHFPAMTAVEVSALVEDGAKVEIEVTAVVPPPKLRESPG